MTGKERERIARLEKRMTHLKDRISAGEAQNKDWFYDKAELSALTWAVEFIKGALDSEVKPC